MSENPEAGARKEAFQGSHERCQFRGRLSKHDAKQWSGHKPSPALIRKRKKLSRRQNLITIKRRCLRLPRRIRRMTKLKRCENCGRPGIRGGLPSKSDFEKRCQLRR